MRYLVCILIAAGIDNTNPRPTIHHPNPFNWLAKRTPKPNAITAFEAKCKINNGVGKLFTLSIMPMIPPFLLFCWFARSK